MGIRVERVTPWGDRLLIRFAEPFLNTDSGNRAFRVLFMHVNSGYSADEDLRTLELGYAAKISAINTRAALQAELDRYADVPIKVTFGKLQLGATGRGPAIRTRADLRAARQAGRTPWVQMKVTASMPVIHRDQERLRKIVPGGVYHINDDPYSYSVSVYLHGDHANANPWRLMNDLKPRIQAAIV